MLKFFDRKKEGITKKTLKEFFDQYGFIIPKTVIIGAKLMHETNF